MGIAIKSPRRRFLQLAVGGAALAVGCAAVSAAAADVRVLSPGGAAPAVRPLAEAYSKQSGTAVAVSSGPPSAVRDKIKAGELFDVVVQSTPAMAETVQSGALAPGSRMALARGGIGVVVRAGGPVPDISTVEGFKRALLAAPRVVYGNPAQANASGELIVRILSTAGILDAVAPKVVRFTDIVPGNEMVAKGEADIGLFNLTAIPYSVGVQLAGPVPPPLQLYTTYEGAVMAKAAAPEAGLAFLKFMASDAAHKTWAMAGFETVPQ
jgi:molybdate transport system substrate-binding protein